MAKKIPLTIGSLQFEKKADALAFIKELLNGPEESVNSKQDFLFNLLICHPRAEQKIGVGVKRIFVGLSTEWKNRCFFIERTDGSKTEFSTNECISPTNPFKRFCEACRQAVSSQKFEFKSRRFSAGTEVRCEISSVVLQNDDCHVDHKIPFVDLVHEFLEETGLSPEAIEYEGWGDNQYTMSFKDKNIEGAWATFHQEKAVLRITSSEANLTRKRKESV